MPTGYTCDLAEKPMTFSQFALRCARAMGACISLRDEPMDMPLPERFMPSNHHGERAAECSAEIVAIQAMDDVARDRMAALAFDEAETQRAAANNQRAALRKAYGSMLASVSKWEPPSDDHVGLKDFMTEQLQSSMKWDCDPKYDRNTPSVRETGAEWAAAKISSLEAAIRSHYEAQAEEYKRVAGRNAWLQALRESLPKK